MPLLPGLISPALLNKRLGSTLFVVLFSFLTLAIPQKTFAAPPAPQACQQPQSADDKLTDNWLTDENKRPPEAMRITATASGARGSRVTAQADAYLTVNFSELSAIFGATNSNYLEGKVQDKEHKESDVSSLSQVDISKFNGAVQKGAPIAWLDAYRLKYVEYINTHPTLAESGDKFADSNGQDPKTIHELVESYGNPQPPSSGGNKETWESTWGRYWEKLPTSYSEFYQAYIEFRAQHKARNDGIVSDSQAQQGDFIGQVLGGELCPYPIERKITFVMPDFFRTTAVSGEVNTLLVPKKAQSCASNDMILQNNQPCEETNIISKVIDKCLKAFKDNPISNSLKKVVKISLEWFFPPPALALEPTEGHNPDCIRAYPNEKKGQAPYCALPQDQLQSGDSCTNQQDQFKLDPDNPNVICTFRIHWQRESMILNYGPGEDEFDTCTNGNQVQCQVAVYIWPIFRVPFQTEIWNNTVYSDTENHEPYLGSPAYQEEGRPGAYTAFTPQAVFEDEFEASIRKCNQHFPLPTDANLPDDLPQDCQDMLNAIVERTGGTQAVTQGILACISQNPQRDDVYDCIIEIAKNLPKKRPGESVGDAAGENVNRRFIGGADCSKEFVWHNALYPKAAQEKYGIKNECPLETAAQAPDNTSPPNNPGSVPPTDDNCSGAYTLNNPIGNFGDPNCELPSEDEIISEIERLDPAHVTIWTCIVTGESGFNPNAYNSRSTAGQALGLFQMGHAAYPQLGLDYQIADGQPYEYDRGDVHWRQQIANAINFNNQHYGGDFFNNQGVSYWHDINNGVCI